MLKRIIVILGLMLSIHSILLAEEKTNLITKIELERTRCFGSCPVYKLSISRNGEIVYHGIKFVKIIDIKKSRINTRDFEKIVKKIYKINFFNLKDEYRYKENPDGSRTGVADRPSTIITVYKRNRKKRILNYFGGPLELEELAKLIDKISNVEKWIR
jgi:hypothetical protein